MVEWAVVNHSIDPCRSPEWGLAQLEWLVRQPGKNLVELAWGDLKKWAETWSGPALAWLGSWAD